MRGGDTASSSPSSFPFDDLQPLAGTDAIPLLAVEDSREGVVDCQCVSIAVAESDSDHEPKSIAVRGRGDSDHEPKSTPPLSTSELPSVRSGSRPVNGDAQGSQPLAGAGRKASG